MGTSSTATVTTEPNNAAAGEPNNATANKGIIEFIRVDKDDVERLEKDILLRRHIERYAIVRQHVYGVVVDCACGVGYGSYLLAKNPDVKKVYGVDISADAVYHARQEFGSNRIEFINGDLGGVDIGKADVLVSLETIEHIPDPRMLAEFAERSMVEEMIVSYPSKKTTHYNKFHLWDIVQQDILDIFSNFIPINVFDYTFDTRFVHLVRSRRNVKAPVRLKTGAKK